MIIGAAEQAKPTTAGGIYTSGMGGVLQGKQLPDFENRNEKLEQYQKNG